MEISHSNRWLLISQGNHPCRSSNRNSQFTMSRQCQAPVAALLMFTLRHKSLVPQIMPNSTFISLSRFIRSFKCSSSSKYPLSSKASHLRTQLIILRIITKINPKNSSNKMSITKCHLATLIMKSYIN